MRTLSTKVVAGIAGLVAIVAPVAVSIYLAGRQSDAAAFQQVALFSSTIVQRSDEIGRQMLAASEDLAKGARGDPCSAGNIALMRQLQFASRYLKLVGHVANDRLTCSSLGMHPGGIALGPVKYVSSRGVSIRPEVELPMAPGKTFFVSERDGSAIVADRALSTDMYASVTDLSAGLFAATTRVPITGTGVFKPQWARALGNAKRVQFFDGEYIVAIQRSEHYDYAAYTALPAIHLQRHSHAHAAAIIPVGVVVGLVLLAAWGWLLRHQGSLPVVIRGALARKEFFLEYQPIVDLHTGKWMGAEALIRWRRRDGTIVHPDSFIPVAEDNGFICDITELVITMVAAEGRAILERHPDFFITVNVSSLDLDTQRIVELLEDLVATAGINPRNVVVEMTERGLMRTDVARGILQEIRAMGIRVAIDDFGTGYSGLAYLGTFEVDYLKIDKGFISTVGTDAATSDVAVHIIAMAKALELEMIAEGVETEAQAVFLRERGVRYAQGWCFGKAMPLQDLLANFGSSRPAA